MSKTKHKGRQAHKKDGAEKAKMPAQNSKDEQEEMTTPDPEDKDLAPPKAPEVEVDLLPQEKETPDGLIDRSFGYVASIGISKTAGFLMAEAVARVRAKLAWSRFLVISTFWRAISRSQIASQKPIHSQYSLEIKLGVTVCSSDTTTMPSQHTTTSNTTRSSRSKDCQHYCKTRH